MLVSAAAIDSLRAFPARFWVAHASRVLASASSRSRSLLLDSLLLGTAKTRQTKIRVRRDAETSTRDARAPRKFVAQCLPLHPPSRHSKRLACQSSHHVPSAKKDDLDLNSAGRNSRATDSAVRFARRDSSRAVLGVAIYFAARPIGGAIKAWQSRRLAREAFALIDQKKWNEAAAKARDAYVLRFTEPESWRAVARVASRTGQWASALEWWKKVDDANRLTAEDRRDFIGAAFVSGEIALAAKQVEALLAQRGGPMPIDIVWAGQVAARQSDPVLALDYAERVLADKRAKPYDVLSAATLVLSLTSPYSQPYADAWKQIEDVARDPKNPGSLDALVLLANEQAVPPMPAIGGNTSLSLESPGPRRLDARPAPPTRSHGLPGAPQRQPRRRLRQP